MTNMFNRADVVSTASVGISTPYHLDASQSFVLIHEGLFSCIENGNWQLRMATLSYCPELLRKYVANFFTVDETTPETASSFDSPANTMAS